ncbi:SpaA isopeptide-forming pilin-related protein [Butyricicoccus sp.]|uniref:SpaA isopeptide-forming pilin-related protein n=1 Tax=Butyricicoccus sp. TaxID=2049021 RepID=UPI003D7D2A9C
MPLTDKDGKDVKWYVEKGGDNVTIDETTGKVTVKAIDKQLVLTTDASKEYADDVQVHCFVLVNGEPKEIGKLHTHATQKYDPWGSGKNNTRYYVTAKQAETVFGEYGFDASEFDPDTNDSQKYIFANAISEKIDRHNNPAKIWADAAAHNFGDKQGVKIPIVNTQDNYRDVALYYVPNNANAAGYVIADYSGTDSQGTYSFSKDTEFLSANSMFSVTATDEAGQFPDETLPDAKYVWSGNKATVTLPYSENATWTAWYCSTDGKLTPLKKVLLDAEKTISNDRKTITFTFSSVSDPILITTGEHTEQEDESKSIKLTAYVALDGTWTEVKTDLKRLQKSQYDTIKSKYYITAEELEYIYGEYGFKSTDWDLNNIGNTRIFGCEGGDTLKDIWADNDPISQGDSWYLPLVAKSNNSVQVFYLPNNASTTEFKGDTARNNAAKANSFYSIKVEDPDGLLGEDVTLPNTKYYLSGKNVSFKLPYKKDVTWTCQNTTNGLAISDKFPKHDGEYIPITIENIDHPITYTTKTVTNDVMVHCYIFVNKEKLEVSTVSFGKNSYKAAGTDKNKWGGDRYYITASDLGKIYGGYGFDVDSYQPDNTKAAEDPQNLYFPIASHIKSSEYDHPDTLWADAYPCNDNDNQGYKVPLTKTNVSNIDLYYAPKNNKDLLGATFSGNKRDSGAIFIGAGSKNHEVNTAFIEANTFYSITAKDEAGKFSGVPLPDTQYALTGTSKTITLPYKDGVNWYIDSDGSTQKITPTTVSDDKKTATYTLENVTKSIKLTTDGLADDEVAVSGYISVNGEWKKVSSTLQKISTAQTDTGSNRYYLTSAQLESLFGSYGFKASDYANKSADELSKHFPSSTIGAETISTNAGSENDNGSWRVNTIQATEDNRVAGIAVYYVPNIKHVTENSFAKTDTDVLTDNQFYIISFEDSTGLANVPSTMYLRGGQVTITVPYKDGVTWSVLGTAPKKNNTDAALYVKQKVSDDGNSAKLTFNLHSNVTATTKTITDRNEIKLEAYVSLNGTWTLLKDTGISRANWNGTNYYITEQELWDIYQAYGFTGLVDGEYHIGVTTRYIKTSIVNDTNMYPDQTLDTDPAGNRFLPLVTDAFDTTGNVIKLYYVPNNKTKNSKGISTANNAAPAKENAFYTITFDDKNNDFPDMDKTEKLFLNGTETTLTLPYKDGVKWIVTDKDGSLIQLEQTTDKKTVTIKVSVDRQLIVTTGQAKNVALAANEVAINAYIAIDDAWVPVGTEWKYTNDKFVGGIDSFTVADTQTTEYTTKDSKGEEIKQTRYYLTVDQLQNIFGSYGFEASSFTDDNNRNIFPHTTINFPAANIYADIPTQQIGGKWSVLFTNKATDGNKGISIYYAPTRSDNRSFWGPNNTNLLRDNSVRYTVSAKDRLGILPSNTSITYPEAVQVKRTENTTYTLPELPAGYHWIPVNKNTGKPLTTATKVEKDKDNPLKYTVSDILEPVQFIVWKDGAKRLTYDARVTPEKLTDTSTFAQPEKQEIVTDGSIEKKPTKSISYETRFNGNDTILPTDSDRAQVTLVESSHPRTFYYIFKGWQIDGTNTIIQPGTKLSDIDGYQNYELISLTAVWKAVDENSRPATVNFYVSLECEIMDNASNGVSGRDKGSFTESVYATRIYDTDAMNKTSQWEDNKNSMFSIIASKSDSTAYDVDATLRKMTDVPIYTTAEQGTNGTTPVSLTLESFPTDEEVLENLRDDDGWSSEAVKKMKLDGKEIKKEDLTTDNFAVRWYVLKYQSADAWHIDGVLVAKEAHAVVTKTFAGNQTAIEKVKKNYSISVTHEHAQTAIDEIEGLSETDETATQDVTTDYTLVLKPNDTNIPDATERGYDSYDPATDTYTWILTGRQGRAYRVKENNYEAPTDKDSSPDNLLYNGTYRYMIKNCTLEDITNDVWEAYEGQTAETGIELVAEAYPTDVPSSAYQTIAFENRYVSAGDLTIQKIDSATQNGLKNVNFTLSRLNEDNTESPDFVLWRKGKTSEYVVELPQADASSDDDDMAKNLEDQGYMVMANKVIMTDQTGYIYIRLPTGKYKLTEEIPLGYKGALTITIDVDANGKISTVSDGDNNQWVNSGDGTILTIKNESRLLTTVTALKQWNDSTLPADRKSVTVELWRNGAKMSGSQYTQTLSADNNWQYEWKNLPLFIDGAVAKYELRETYIGSTAYDAGADEDGYADYNVSYETAKYCDGDERPETEDKLVNTSGFTQSKATWQDSDDETHYATHALFVVNNSLAKGYISFQKMDGLNRALQGAEFTLYSDESCSAATAVATAESQKDGTVQFAAQPAGTYYMKETKAPTGYALDTTIYTVTVSDIGNVKITKPSDNKDDDDGKDTVMRITNVSDRTLTLRKVSSTSGAQPLEGATFTIKRNDTDLGTFTTGSDGTTDFGGLRLDDGHYTITETQAPSGYTKLIDHIDLIVEDGKVSLGQHGTEAELKESGNSYILTVENKPESGGVLPSTGDFRSSALAALLGAALMCGASALALWLRKRRQNTP